jgi:hypothetical protein
MLTLRRFACHLLCAQLSCSPFPWNPTSPHPNTDTPRPPCLQVWLARYCGTPVAAKILARVKVADLTSSQQHLVLLSNLRDEARLMSQLRHPHGGLLRGWWWWAVVSACVCVCVCVCVWCGGGGFRAAREDGRWMDGYMLPPPGLHHPACTNRPPLAPPPPPPHAAVCLYFGACLDPPCLVMEYCARKSLDLLLKEGREEPSGQVAGQEGCRGGRGWCWWWCVGRAHALWGCGGGADRRPAGTGHAAATQRQQGPQTRHRGRAARPSSCRPLPDAPPAPRRRPNPECLVPQLARQLTWERLLGIALDAARGMLYLREFLCSWRGGGEGLKVAWNACFREFLAAADGKGGCMWQPPAVTAQSTMPHMHGVTRHLRCGTSCAPPPPNRGCTMFAASPQIRFCS